VAGSEEELSLVGAEPGHPLWLAHAGSRRSSVLVMIWLFGETLGVTTTSTDAKPLRTCETLLAFRSSPIARRTRPRKMLSGSSSSTF
jgi:hypothetical protein